MAAQAIELGLVDELRMFRYPVVSVAARRSCHASPTPSRWDLVETRTFGSRVIYERYRPPAMSWSDTAYTFATSVAGRFAVGDVRAGSVKRVASAVGEGSVVVSAVHSHLGGHR